jgi:hypothetical protein
VASVPSPMRRRHSRSLAITLGLLAAACGKPSPVGHVEAQPQSLQLGYPEIRELRLEWEPTRALDPAAGAPTVFVHLLDRKGKIVRTFDHPFPQAWQEGTPVTDVVRIFQSALVPPLPPGTYQLALGLYGTRSHERWPLDVAGPDLRRHEYRVAEVEVPRQATSGSGPRLAFTGKWLASEPGGSRQVVAFRWLEGPGALRVSGIASPGTLWLAFKIPAGGGPAEKLVVEDASNAPSVVVSGSCSKGVETGLSGAGPHEIEIPVEAAPADGACEVRLRPNFRFLKAGLPPRSVALENVAWAPGPASPAPDSSPAPATPEAPR